ncbi:alpha/beta hydrolase [Pseudomonas moorei]|nr:alpha/beta hydrolase [Pseudomonas moorei]
MPFFDWNGISLHYSDEGEGAPLVFLHGLGGRSENWTYQRRYFSSRFRVICPDLPGQGLSQGRDIHFSQYWEVIRSLLDHLSLGCVSICGLSKGARVGMALAAYQSDRVGKMIVINAFAHLLDVDRDARVNIYNMLSYEGGRDEWARTLLKMMGIKKNTAIERGFLFSASVMDAEHIRSLFMQIVDIDQRLDLFNVRAKTLLISGGRDEFIPPYCMPEIAREIPQSTLIRYPSLGHLPYLESPDLFNSTVEQFMSS